MDNGNLISVVIPMYNAEMTIMKTLLSIVKQTQLPFEIIIVDDGSTDNSVSIVKNFIQINPSLNWQLIKKSNGGVSSARNAGIISAKGDWIALLDSDDEWFESKIERQMGIVKSNSRVDFIATGRENFTLNRILWYKFSVLTHVPVKLLFIKFIFQPSTVLFRKSIINEIGLFDENQKYAEEGIFFIKICHRFNAFFLNEKLVLNGGGKHHYGESGLSGNLKEMEKGELKNLKNAYNLSIINFFEFSFFVFYSLVKYFRRILVVKYRKYDVQ